MLGDAQQQLAVCYWLHDQHIIETDNTASGLRHAAGQKQDAVSMESRNMAQAHGRISNYYKDLQVDIRHYASLETLTKAFYNNSHSSYGLVLAHYLEKTGMVRCKQKPILN